VLQGATIAEIDAVFVRIANEKRVQGLLVAAEPLLNAARVQLAILAARFAVPAIYPLREFADAGGLFNSPRLIRGPRQGGAGPSPGDGGDRIGADRPRRRHCRTRQTDRGDRGA
jgi:putative ABC transport system substrate-binding protein